MPGVVTIAAHTLLSFSSDRYAWILEGNYLTLVPVYAAVSLAVAVVPTTAEPPVLEALAVLPAPEAEVEVAARTRVVLVALADAASAESGASNEQIRRHQRRDEGRHQRHRM